MGATSVLCCSANLRDPYLSFITTSQNSSPPLTRKPQYPHSSPCLPPHPLLFVNLGWCHQFPPGPTAADTAFCGTTGIRSPEIRHVGPAVAALGWTTVREMIAQRDAVNVYRALRVVASHETLQAMFCQRSAVSESLTGANARGRSCTRAARSPPDDLAAALSLQSSCGLECTASRRDFFCLQTQTSEPF